MYLLKTLFIAASLLFALPVNSEILIIGGSGTDLATFRLLAASFQNKHPGVNITVKPSVGSGGGVRAVNKSIYHLGLLSRPPKPKEQSSSLVFKPYARTPLVFAVSKTSPIQEITAQQAANIYAGKTVFWPEGTAAKPVLRPKNDSDTLLLKQSLLAFEQALPLAYQRKELPVALTDQEAVDMIKHIKGAIGTTTLAVILSENKPLRALKLDGVDPNTLLSSDDSYPMYKSLYMAFRRNHGNSTVQAFLDYFESGEARKILHDTGHFPFSTE